MSLETEFTEILGQLSQFQSAIGRVHQTLRAPKEREILGDLIAKIEQARQDAQTAVPAAIRKIHEATRDVEQRAQAQQAKLDVLQKQLEERQKNPPKPPAPPAPPPVKFDPNLGAELCRELLQHLSPPHAAASSPGVQVVKEIWEDWN